MGAILQEKKTIVLCGASGLIGKALVKALEDKGYRCRRLVRRQPRDEQEIFWDPYAGKIDSAGLEGCHGVINLSGESIVDFRWTQSKKQRIYDSRVVVSRFLAESIASLKARPSVYLQACAIGIYGDQGIAELDEDARLSSDFIGNLCKDWELQAEKISDSGVRTVCFRLGVVLSSKGGVLARMKLPFSLGLGGRLGSGKQFFSWVDIEDVVAAFVFGITKQSLSGAVNLVAPNPVPNSVFTKELARVLGRPAFFPVPELLIRVLFGEMGDALFLTSCRVVPKKLISNGFRFSSPKLSECLQRQLHGRVS